MIRSYTLTDTQGQKKNTLSRPHRDENQPSESQMGLGVPQQGLEPPAQPSPSAVTQPHRAFGVLMHIPPCSTTSLSPSSGCTCSWQ